MSMLRILLFSLALSLSGAKNPERQHVVAGAEDVVQLEFGSVRGNLNKGGGH